MTHDESSGRWLRPKDAAQHVGISTSSLAKMRVFGTGPRYAKLGRSIVYDKADLDAFCSARLRRSTSESDFQVVEDAS